MDNSSLTPHPGDALAGLVANNSVARGTFADYLARGDLGIGRRLSHWMVAQGAAVSDLTAYEVW